MKPIWSVIIFLFLLSSSVLSSIHSYRCAREDIEADLNRALTLTLRHKKDLYITPDTIRTYRSYITLDRVRNSAFLTYSRPDEKPVSLSSRSMICRVGNESLSFRGRADCSMATVFFLSDQRPALLLMLLCLMWTLANGICRHRKAPLPLLQPEIGTRFGGLRLDSGNGCFLDENNDVLHFTPMQRRLMQLFFSAQEHRLSKKQICQVLWPKKDHAEETLYTLIRRLRPILKEHSRLEIKSFSGEYQLTEKEL